MAIADVARPGVVIDYPEPRAGQERGPSARQRAAHMVEADELLYGGAAGGGKTDWVIAEVIAVLMEFPGSNGAIFRRTHPQLSELGGIEQRLLDLIPTWAGTYNATKYIWTFRNGSKLRLCHCDSDKDVTKYQGAEWAIVAFDQLEQFTEYQYRYLLHRLRVSGALADVMAEAGYKPKAIATANPGGVGHGWVKGRFIDPFPLGGTIFRPFPTLDDPDPGTRVFIPATVDDNPNVDEGYIARLDRLPEDQRRAMRYGDWNVFAGQRFRDFRTDVHVIDPEQLPIPIGAGITRGVGVDYGLDAPFCALWGALLPDGLVVVYRELYKPGLLAREQAELILGAEAPGERRPGRPSPVWLDPSTWARSPVERLDADVTYEESAGAPPPGSIAWHYRNTGVPVEKATNDRLAGVGVVANALRVRRDGLPRLLIYSTCRNLIRTLPSLVRDERRPEDVDTKGEDHAYDALRYLLMGLAGLAPAGPAAAGASDPVAPRTPDESIPADTADVMRANFD